MAPLWKLDGVIPGCIYGAIILALHEAIILVPLPEPKNGSPRCWIRYLGMAPLLEPKRLQSCFVCRRKCRKGRHYLAITLPTPLYKNKSGYQRINYIKNIYILRSWKHGENNNYQPKQVYITRPGDLLLLADIFWCRKDFPAGCDWLCDLAGAAGLLKGFLDTGGFTGDSSCGWLNMAAIEAIAALYSEIKTFIYHAGKNQIIREVKNDLKAFLR